MLFVERASELTLDVALLCSVDNPNSIAKSPLIVFVTLSLITQNIAFPNVPQFLAKPSSHSLH